MQKKLLAVIVAIIIVIAAVAAIQLANPPSSISRCPTHKDRFSSTDIRIADRGRHGTRSPNGC